MLINSPDMLHYVDTLYVVRLHREWDEPKNHKYSIGSIQELHLSEDLALEVPDADNFISCYYCTLRTIHRGGELKKPDTMPFCQTRTSLQDMGVVPNRYNDHQTFSTYEEATWYVKTKFRSEPRFDFEVQVTSIDVPARNHALEQDTHAAEPNFFVEHDGGLNGMGMTPFNIEPEVEAIMPPEGETDASIPNLFTVAA